MRFWGIMSNVTSQFKEMVVIQSKAKGSMQGPDFPVFIFVESSWEQGAYCT